jgi:hypothetical protein
MNRVRESRSRRSLFAGVLRCGALGLLGVAGAGTAVKRRRLIEQGRCTGDGLCHGCGALQDCRLPLALYAKELVDRGDDGQRQR